jgi:prevent-host-death family protein
MHTASWRLQEAKNQFSKVVDAALHGVPPHVTRRGHDAAVVVAASDYEQMLRNERADSPGFVAHLLAVPQDDVEFVRVNFILRDAEF